MDFGLPWSRACLPEAVAIDGNRVNEEGARLRWFIVEPGLQGRGIGRILIQTAIEFLQRSGPQTGIFVDFQGPGSGPQSV